MNTRRFATTCLLVSTWTGTAAAQIDYALSLDLAKKTWTVEGKLTAPAGGDVDYWIPRWTAGAYHLAEFGRFVTKFEAFGVDGESLSPERQSDCHWKIPIGERSEIVIRYEADSISKAVFSNGTIDVEANRITADYAYVNPASLFGFVADREDQPVTLKIELPEGWSAATVLEQDEGGVYHADSYLRFEDSPFLFSPSFYEWEGITGGKPLRVTIHGKDESEAKKITEDCVAIVKSASGLMRGLPYERYQFLFGFVPEGQGAGLEHSYSTLILMPQTAPPKAVMGVTAHEFFHLWCAERIHVEAIHEPDYTAPLVTSSLWVNEGITEYITRHILLHAGLTTRDEFLNGLAVGEATQPEEAVWTNVSRGAADWADGAGIMDWMFSMYHQGPRTIFGLDLEMRRASGGEVGIIDLVHHLVEEYVEQDRGFREGGMVEIINGVAGADVSSYYEQYIDGPKNPDLGEYLEVIGYRLAGSAVSDVGEPTTEQLRARDDLFSISGTPGE